MGNDLESSIKNVIATLRRKKGWPPGTERMTLTTRLNAHYICILRKGEVGWIQKWLGQYIPFKEFARAVHTDFGIPFSTKHRLGDYDWKTIGEVLAYVQKRKSSMEERLERKKEKEAREKAQKAREERSRRIKENRKKKKQKEAKEKARQEEHQPQKPSDNRLPTKSTRRKRRGELIDLTQVKPWADISEKIRQKYKKSAGWQKRQYKRMLENINWRLEKMIKEMKKEREEQKHSG